MATSNNFDFKERGLVIIGNGITGITAARTVRKLHPKLRIRIVSVESDYFFSRTALMYIYMGHMRLKDTQPYEPRFFHKNRLELIRDRVVKIDTDQKQLQLANKPPLSYDILLLATGSTYNTLGWPGQDLAGVQGLYSLQDLQKLDEYTRPEIKHAVIVGGGLIGIELGEMLHTRGVGVTFLVREDRYWGNILPFEEAELVQAEIRQHHIGLHLSTELKEILPGENGQAVGVRTNHGENIPCQLVGLTVGVRPDLSALTEDCPIETARGILVDKGMRTNFADVFAAGDCAQLRRPDNTPGAVEQLWYTGRMQGSVAGRLIARYAYEEEKNTKKAAEIPSEPYDRGIWFNSAKFFTIEYQTYGQVPADIGSEKTFVWQDAKDKCLIRLVWEGNGPQSLLLGMNFLGARYRQDICTRWIQEKRSAAYAAQYLQAANFDPETHRSVHKRFQRAFQKRFPSTML